MDSVVTLFDAKIESVFQYIPAVVLYEVFKNVIEVAFAIASSLEVSDLLKEGLASRHLLLVNKVLVGQALLSEV